jgi:hypothetical protein
MLVKTLVGGTDRYLQGCVCDQGTAHPHTVFVSVHVQMQLHEVTNAS